MWLRSYNRADLFSFQQTNNSGKNNE